MTRFMTVAMLMLSCMIGSVLGQTDVQESRPTRPETRRIPATVERNFPVKPAESSPGRAAAQVAPPVVPEAVSVISSKPGENERERIVFALRNLPATNAAATLQSLFKTEGSAASQEVKDKVVIVPEMANNSLVVSGPPTAVKEISRLLSELDRPAAIVRLEVRITEAPGDTDKKPAGTESTDSMKTDHNAAKKVPAKTGEADLLAHADLTTLDGQPALVMFGRQEPHISSTSQTNFGRSNSITYTNVGTMFNLTPRVSSDGTIVLELDISDSRSGPMEEGVVLAKPDKGPEVRAQNLDTLQIKTTLHLQDGQPQMITGISRSGKTRQITITAHVIR